MDATLTDPTREECEAGSEVLSESLRQPDDGYLLCVAEDVLRAAARVRLRAEARVKLAASCVDRIDISDELVADVTGVARERRCVRCGILAEDAARQAESICSERGHSYADVKVAA